MHIFKNFQNDFKYNKYNSFKIIMNLRIRFKFNQFISYMNQ